MDLFEQLQIDLANDDKNAIKVALAEMHEADLADLVKQLHHDDRIKLIKLLGPNFSAEILPYLEGTIRDEIVAHITPSNLAKAVREFETDDAVGLIEDLDKDVQRKVLAHLPKDARQIVEEGLTFPEKSAGRLMQRDLIAVPPFWTVKRLLDYIKDQKSDLPDDFYDIYIVDPMHRVIGALPLSRALRKGGSVKLEEILNQEIRTIPATMDQGDVAHQFRQYNLISAPVVDAAERLIGLITVDDVVDVIDEEAEADILHLAGVGGVDFYAPTLITAWHRLRWLFITLLNTIVASYVISNFQATIEHLVVLAVLLPITAAMGGNAGMQVVTVTVRALATKDLRSGNMWRAIGKEIGIGLINGGVLAITMGIIATFWFHHPGVGLVLATAMAINLVWAGIAGTMIPLSLAKMGVDPAVTAGPILTTTTDILGFLMFLGLAKLFLIG